MFSFLFPLFCTIGLVLPMNRHFTFKIFVITQKNFFDYGEFFLGVSENENIVREKYCFKFSQRMADLNTDRDIEASFWP